MVSAAYRLRRKRGNLLMIAMALAIILAVLVSALHNYEVVTRRALSGDEADILLVQARRWEMGRALNKIPVSLQMPPEILVTTTPVAVKNEIYVTDKMGLDLFARDSKGAWNGFPNLVVKRSYQIDPAAPALPAPPNFKEFRGTPRSPNPSYEVYNGRTFRHMTGDFLPVAALAPAGSVNLDGCAAWPNPDLDDNEVKAWERFSGLPVHVAAGTTARVDNMTYGTIHAVQSITAANSSQVLPMVGTLPYSSDIAAQLLSQIGEARVALCKSAQTLDDKTLQISGAPPTIGNMMDLIFTDAVNGDTRAVLDKLQGWLSIRSATEFPFISLPGFATMAIPGTYISFQVWFHAPFAPDTEGFLSTGGQTPSQMAVDLANRLRKVQEARGAVYYMLSQIRGGNAVSDTPLGELTKPGRPTFIPSGPYDENGLPTGPSTEGPPQTGQENLPEPRINPGLKARGTTLQSDLQADLTTLEKAKTDGSTAAVTTGLKTNQGLLAWMADYQGYLYDDSNQVPPTGVTSNLGMEISPLSYNLSATGVSPDTSDMYRNDVGYPSLNKGMLLKTKAVFPRAKDFQGKVLTARDPSAAPTQYYGPPVEANQLKPGQPISENQWKTILDSPDEGNANPPKLGPLDRQLELFRFLTSSTDPNNPFNKVVALEASLQQQLARLDQLKADINLALTAERAARKGIDKASRLNNLPKTRAAERTNKYKGGVYAQFQQGKGLLGYAYLRYGFSYDVLWNAISYLADQSGDADGFWSTHVPLVWWGYKDNTGAIQADPGLDIKATFTVPQSRTFYYKNSVTIRGDLWLQRGSTMVVGGDLRVATPFGPPISTLGSYTQAMSFLPSGRIFMEEGSSLVVLGPNGVYCTGPVVPTGQPHAVRPISTAIIVPNGDAVLRFGVAPGVGLCDILQSPDMQPTGNFLNKEILYPLVAQIFPNMGKVYPLGPFHRRLCYFAKNCTQYGCLVFIGPFGIPIPVVVPWPMPRANLNVTLYRGLSLLYAISSNIQLGENLYPACDWWPFGQKENCGFVPILPKLSLSSFGLDSGLNAVFDKVKNVTIPSAQEISRFFGDGLKKLDPTDPNSVFRTVAEKMLTNAVASALASMIPAPFDLVLSPLITSILPADDSQSDESSGPYPAMSSGMTSPFAEVAAKVEGIVNKQVDAFQSSLMHEVTGVLVSAQQIKIGYKLETFGGAMTAMPAGKRPLMASGLFVANYDIDINADYTVGAVISAGGSINKDKAASTRLLYYPAFTRACLYQPGLTPTITTDLNRKAGALPQFLVRAMDVEYGVAQSKGSGHAGLDVYYPSAQVTAQGWEQR